ncbi:MAG: DUF1636 domain-containing protein, partial [Paracoccaceae bacterium]
MFRSKGLTAANGATMTTWITICDTCKREGWENGNMAQTDGEVLAALVEARA